MSQLKSVGLLNDPYNRAQESCEFTAMKSGSERVSIGHAMGQSDELLVSDIIFEQWSGRGSLNFATNPCHTSFGHPRRKSTTSFPTWYIQGNSCSGDVYNGALTNYLPIHPTHCTTDLKQPSVCLLNQKLIYHSPPPDISTLEENGGLIFCAAITGGTWFSHAQTGGPSGPSNPYLCVFSPCARAMNSTNFFHKLGRTST